MQKNKEDEEDEEEIIPNLHVRRVNKRLWERFKGAVAMKTGKMHGVLGIELNEALSLYLDMIENEGEEGTCPQKRGAHTHDRKDRKVITDNGIMYGKGYVPSQREKKLEEVGRILYQKVEAFAMRGKKFKINKAGLERLIVAQHVSEARVIKSYIKTLELKGWIIATSAFKGRYKVMDNTISEDLDIPVSEEFMKKKIEAINALEEAKKINEF